MLVKKKVIRGKSDPACRLGQESLQIYFRIRTANPWSIALKVQDISNRTVTGSFIYFIHSLTRPT